MTRTSRQILLGVTAGLTLVMLIVFLAKPAIARDADRPGEIAALARWLADHPADWLAASLIADRALDTTTSRRSELWRTSYAHAVRLAPHRPNPAAAFVRGGLFHWYELSPADRTEVLRVAAPMLRDPVFFERMHRPLFDLTRDLTYLRSNAPDTENAVLWLRDLAAMNGLFADYRELRAAVAAQRVRKFEERKDTLSAAELIRLVPNPITRDHEPLVRRVLAQLQRRPLDSLSAPGVAERAADLAEFAIRHRLKPLDGLDVLVETREAAGATRARLAGALGRREEAALITAREPERPDNARWTGTCGGNDVCSAATATITASSEITLEVAAVQSDEIPPYVEIYVDDERLAEGPIDESRRFTLPVRAAGPHRVEVRLINPQTRNRFQRRIRLS